MGFLYDALQNALPITSSILLPIGFSIDKSTGLHLSLGYILNALVGMTKIPYISATLQVYLSLNSVSVLQSLFFGKYELQEPWVQLLDYYIVFMDMFQYFIVVIEPLLFAIFIRFINKKVVEYRSIKQFFVLVVCFVLYTMSMLKVLRIQSIVLNFITLIIHVLIFLMYTTQNEPITGPILLFTYVNHLYDAPVYQKTIHWSSMFLTQQSAFYKLLSWSTFTGVIFSYHIWDMLLKSMLMLVLSYRIKGLELLMRPLLLILYTDTLKRYFYAESDYKEIQSVVAVFWHMLLLHKETNY
eukprot:NODE_333_length_10741_cov_0.423135.p3 type:complete len:298 gc:universal NODE_333_length_10741_cov_0.423135:10529-9636(-)